MASYHYPNRAKAVYNSIATEKAEAKCSITATVQKIISEVLQSPSVNANAGQEGANMTFAKEARDLLIDCCVEFITMLSSEANDIAEKDAKKTIACEHITKALEELGFGDYVPELMTVADQFKSSQAVCHEGTTLVGLWSTKLIITAEPRTKTKQGRAERYDQ